MTGKEALEMLNHITEIYNFLMVGNDKAACYHLGVLSERLAQIIRNDEFSKPTSRCS